MDSFIQFYPVILKKQDYDSFQELMILQFNKISKIC
jgi:hypothetical protein